MAKINPVKLKQDADKLEKAGKLDQAIGLYRQIIEDNPRDWNTINKVGDLYAKLTKTREATVEYAKVADFYAKDGFYVRAIAMWKKINKLDASALEPYTNLAELYAKQGLMTEAKSHFQMVVDEYVKRGKNREADDVLKKLAENMGYASEGHRDALRRMGPTEIHRRSFHGTQRWLFWRD